MFDIPKFKVINEENFRELEKDEKMQSKLFIVQSSKERKNS